MTSGRAREGRELERRERLYRGSRPPPALAGHCVVLVDDGLATGSTMLAAVAAALSPTPGTGSAAPAVLGASAPVPCGARRAEAGVPDFRTAPALPRTFPEPALVPAGVR